MVEVIRLKITCGLESVDARNEQQRFIFRISPLVPSSNIFLCMMYVHTNDVNKHLPNNRRLKVARELRARHSATWRRYHDWLETRQ